MSGLKKYVRRYWPPFLVAFAFLSLEAFAEVRQPALMAQIVDSGVGKGDLAAVWRLGVQMLVAVGIGAVGGAGRNFVASVTSQSFGADLRVDLFARMQGLSFNEVDRVTPGSLVTRLTNDVTQLQNFANGMMRIFVRAPINCIGAIVMMWTLDAQLAVFLALLVPVAALLIYLSMHIGFPMFTRVQNAIDGLNARMREYLAGVRVIKAFSRYAYEEQMLTGQAQELSTSSRRAARVMAVFSPMLSLTVNAGIVFLLWRGGYRVRSGAMEVGVVMAFVTYMAQIFQTFNILSNVFNMLTRARASVRRVNEVLSARGQDGGDAAALPQSGTVSFSHVVFSYRAQGEDEAVEGEGNGGGEGAAEGGDAEGGEGGASVSGGGNGESGAAGAIALNDLSFEARSGETLAILGPTGSGKSTIVNLLLRFYKPDAGVVSVFGADVSQVAPEALHDRVAVAPQKNVLFSGTIAENLRWGKPDATAEELWQAVRSACADEFVERFPEGLDTVLGQGGVNLSGGQKQRLSIARAVLKDARVLILDDCTSAVDVATEARILEALRALNKDMVRILITQRISTAMGADKILVLDEGRRAGFGAHEELLKTCAVYKDIYLSQVGGEVA